MDKRRPGENRENCVGEDPAGGDLARPLVPDDLDVVVLRRDRRAVQETFADWDLWAADPPGSLRPWSTGELLPPQVHDVWCRRARSGPWRLQLMLADADGDRWLFRRNPRITAPLPRLGRRTVDGIPFISP